MGLFDIFKKKKQPEQITSQKISDLGIKINVSMPKPLTQEEFDATIIPVEKRVQKAIACKQGLFPHEILILSYAHTFYTDQDSFQRFWWTSYGVRDVQAVLTSLQERGFLQVSDLRAVLDRQTVADIKEVLKASNKKITGKKAELVQRALDELSEAELIERFPKRTYSLTEAGQLALNESAYIPYIHRKSIEGLDIWSLNRLVNTKPLMPYRDKIWGYFNKQSLQHFSDNDFGLYRNCRFEMSQFLMEEKKTKDALLMLAEVVFCDLSGASNNYDPQHLGIYAKHLFPYENSLARTAPGIISLIVKCQKDLQYSDDELKSTLIERMSKLSMPLQLFTVEECVEIVVWEREQNIEELEKMYSNARKAFKQQYPNIKI